MFLRAQDLLKKKLIKEDEFEGDSLKYVGGVDISFLKEDSSVACGTLVVLNLQTLQVVYEDFSLVTVQVPYVPGFLAFREVSFPSFVHNHLSISSTFQLHLLVCRLEAFVDLLLCLFLIYLHICRIPMFT